MPSNVKHVRKANRILVLNSIIQNREQTVGDIIHSTGLSRPTVVNIINELIDDDLLLKSGFAPADIGRQSTLFSINTTSNFAIGVDLDFPPVSLAISDLAGKEIFHDYWEMLPESDIKHVVSSIIDHIENALKQMKLNRKNCLGIGIGIPSIKNDIRAGRKFSVARIHEWKSLNIDEYLSKHLDMKVFMRNDAQLLGMRENSLHNDPKTSFLFVLLRWGIGMAIFMNGILYEGTFGNGGQISHMVIDPFSKDECYCGSNGCLELYASKKAILRSYQECLAKNNTKTNEITVEAIFKLGEKSDPVASKILERAGKAFGTALSSIIKILDIPNVIISGLDCSKTNPYWRSMQKTVKKYTAHFEVQEPVIARSTISTESYGMGGCYYVLKNYFDANQLPLNATGNF
jgi:predicted NBD/HSP70 family sugar kinase